MTNPDYEHRDPDLRFCGFHHLMPNRVQKVLLVSSLYESFVLEEEGLLTELITSEYLVMNLGYAPRVSRVSTGREALEIIESQSVDLVLTMTRLSHWSVPDFASAVKQIRPNLPVVVLAGEPRELARHPELSACENIDRTFVWSGDARILLAIIKFVEDSLNVEHDTQVGDVRVILLVENSVRFYSTYLPLIYAEVVKLTQSLLAEGINPMHRLLRMRARPKILLAENYEEAWKLYSKYGDYLLGIISDVRFPRENELDDEAGLRFVQSVRQDSPHLPVLLQSSNTSFVRAAADLQASFLNKGSHRLHQELRGFLLNSLGFGDFIFLTPDRQEMGRARDLQTFEEAIKTIPDDCLLFHARNNHFSNWLMARTEFALAARIRPRRVTDFATVDELRTYLLQTLAEFRERSQAGVITEFSPARLHTPIAFTRIGGGSMGGKARGLAFINALIRRHSLRREFNDAVITVPSSAAVGTDVFDAFLDENGLREPISQDLEDEEIAKRFLDAKVPSMIYNDLLAFLRLVRYPLAIRSSSLLEDSHDRPFAGIYATHMVPNNHPDLRVRMDQLCDAIKLVYASTFFRSARRYLQATGRHAEEEKMGVILQQIVGSEHGGCFYPTFSGVARSYNFYPAGSATPDDGVASVALGLGKTVVEGGQSLLFCPAQPNVLPQCPTIGDMLANSQREFYALDISHPGVYPSMDTEANLLRHPLSVAEEDGTLAPIGSVYSAENDAVYDGLNRPGTRLVTFAHVLKSGLFPLADVLRRLLEIGHEGMACPVEIEFAVNMTVNPAEFGVLQIRPIVSHEEYEDVALDNFDPADTVCYSPQVLGNGRMCGVRDIVYVKPDQFDAAFTREIAAEFGLINDKLLREKRKCVMIGSGRWGTSDRWLGIPVAWDQISSVQVLVETTLDGFVITPSQGTHFFQNLTSLGIGYFTVDPSVDKGAIDWDWLARQESASESRFVRHIRLSEPLDIRVDGRTRTGAILKPSS